MSQFVLAAAVEADAVPFARPCCFGARAFLLSFPSAVPEAALAELPAFALTPCQRLAHRLVPDLLLSSLLEAASDTSSSESKAVDSVMVDRASPAMNGTMVHMCVNYPSAFFARAARSQMCPFRDVVALDSVMASVFQTCGCHVRASQSACECAMPPLK